MEKYFCNDIFGSNYFCSNRHFHHSQRFGSTMGPWRSSKQFFRDMGSMGYAIAGILGDVYAWQFFKKASWTNSVKQRNVGRLFVWTGGCLDYRNYSIGDLSFLANDSYSSDRHDSYCSLL